MPTVETSLGHLEAVLELLELKTPLSYVFKMACGCSVYNKDDVLGHLWDKCENQASEFWCERYMENGRTVKHHIRIDEIANIWAGVDIVREDLEALRAVSKTLHDKLDFKNAHEYVRILEEYHPINLPTMTILEEKQMRERIHEWYLRENVIPPQFEEIHILSLAKTALNSILAEFEKADVERLTLFGFGDQLS